jgi:hypothetical protein
MLTDNGTHSRALSNEIAEPEDSVPWSVVTLYRFGLDEDL